MSVAGFGLIRISLPDSSPVIYPLRDLAAHYLYINLKRVWTCQSRQVSPHSNPSSIQPPKWFSFQKCRSHFATSYSILKWLLIASRSYLSNLLIPYYLTLALQYSDTGLLAAWEQDTYSIPQLWAFSQAVSCAWRALLPPLKLLSTTASFKSQLKSILL